MCSHKSGIVSRSCGAPKVAFLETGGCSLWLTCPLAPGDEEEAGCPTMFGTVSNKNCFMSYVTFEYSPILNTAKVNQQYIEHDNSENNF